MERGPHSISTRTTISRTYIHLSVKVRVDVLAANACAYRVYMYARTRESSILILQYKYIYIMQIRILNSKVKMSSPILPIGVMHAYQGQSMRILIYKYEWYLIIAVYLHTQVIPSDIMYVG